VLREYVDHSNTHPPAPIAPSAAAQPPHTPALRRGNPGAATSQARRPPFGIWFAGALRPCLAKEDIRALRAAPLSGGWRQIDGNLELVAALTVNVPGFPIVAANQRRGEQVSLIGNSNLSRNVDSPPPRIGAERRAVLDDSVSGPRRPRA
jgi:hypothetical protein